MDLLWAFHQCNDALVILRASFAATCFSASLRIYLLFFFDILNEVALHICADDSILMEIFEKVNGELDGH
jgi:hypothetical protein